MINYTRKVGRKIVSRELPKEWQKVIKKFLKKYKVNRPIFIIHQTTMSHVWSSYSVKKNTAEFGYCCPSMKNVGGKWTAIFLIKLWPREDIFTNLVHELAHAYLYEEEKRQGVIRDSLNTEENADRIVAKVLLGKDELPLKNKSLSGMSYKQIIEWRKKVNEQG